MNPEVSADTGPGPAAETRRVLESVARDSRARLVAYLASTTGDLAAAEDAVGEALLAALAGWPASGVPLRPETWLLTVARRRLVDAYRRREVAQRALPDLARAQEERLDSGDPEQIPDRRLHLMFACAHPAVDPSMHAPMVLQTILGLDAALIAEAFLVPPTTMGQRLVRVKAKIKQSGIPFSLPDREELPERLGAVLDAVYAAYGFGWDDLAGADPARDRLVGESLRLARLLVELLPDEPEARGLLSLLLGTEARRPARLGTGNRFVPLDEQDVSLWSRELLLEAEQQLGTARSLNRLGPYQLQAAIAAVHNQRAVTGVTLWSAVAALHDGLVVVRPSVGAVVARAAAYRVAHGPDVALGLLAALPPELVERYQPYWVLRAHCLHDLGDPATEVAAATAYALTSDPVVAAHLAQRFCLPAAQVAPDRADGHPR